MNLSIEDMVKDHLESHGYDGLFNADLECGCLLEDLMPCGEPELQECCAGYKHPADPDADYDFIIGPEKP